MYDDSAQEIAIFAVSADNTKDDKYHPVNIQQKESAEKFFAFLGGFMNEVIVANGATATGKPSSLFSNCSDCSHSSLRIAQDRRGSFTI